MRFSILALETARSDSGMRRCHDLPRFVAEQNVTCICVSECEASCAVELETELAQLGLKYRHESAGNGGPAILTQLPVLGSVVATDGCTVGVRLGVSPQANIDVFTTGQGYPVDADRAGASLAGLIESANYKFAQSRERAPRRRGRPRVPAEPARPPVRLVFATASYPFRAFVEDLAAAGFRSVSGTRAAVAMKPGLKPTSTGEAPCEGLLLEFEV
jgi:hypothetical protein